MVIKREIYNPIILTIPDDAAIFSVLNPLEKMAKKIILENYINFYCYKDSQAGTVLFRFQDTMKIRSIQGLEQMFITMDFLKKYYCNIEIAVNLLNEKYSILMPVDKSSITFYGEKAKGTHIMLVYGFDLSRKVLLCKDFSRGFFVEFEVSFKEMKDSIIKYDRSYTEEADGLLAFRVNNRMLPQINYPKVYCEFDKLRQEFRTDRAGYGLGAIDLYLDEVKGYPPDDNYVKSWYVIANYMREAAKLIKYRYDFLKEEAGIKEKTEWKEGDDNIKKLRSDTDYLFLKICMMRRKNIVIDANKVNALSGLIIRCREDFKLTANYFCEIISSRIERGE